MLFNFEEYKSVADINSVPEQFRGVYEEGKDAAGATVYTVSEGAAGLIEAYTGTNTALDSARLDKKKASDESAARRQALKAVNDFIVEAGLELGDDPVETLRNHFNELSESVKNGKEMKVDLDKIRKEYEVRLAEVTDNHTIELSEKDTALSKHLIQDVATREIVAAKGAADLLIPHVQNHCKVVKTETGDYEVRVVDAQGDIRSDGAGGWMGVKGLVAELKNNETFGRAFESETKSGSGTPPGGSSRIVNTNTGGDDKTSVQKISEALGNSQGKKVFGAGAPA